VKLGIDSITKGGTIVVVGLFGGDITISTPFIPMKAMTLQGSYVGSPKELKELLALVRKTRMPPIPIDRRPLSEANAGLMDLKAGKVVGRVVLTPAL
jgi:D-arabinose 1-dehydrogenase-like Zn-dependent alcohol dehydrogenase